jgi:uncharacterized protein (TIGR02466 family)
MNAFPLGRVETSADRLVYWHFATPVLQWTLPFASERFNRTLMDEILARRAADPKSRQISNRGGWQSSRDLFTWPTSECAMLRDAAIDAMHRITRQMLPPDAPPLAAAIESDSWANVSPSGAFHVVHSHGGYSWSGVYYPATVEAGDNGGRMELLDPRANVGIVGVTENSEIRFVVAPKAGLMVMFPSWLQHYVTPHQNDTERISVAFNLRIRPKTT